MTCVGRGAPASRARARSAALVGARLRLHRTVRLSSYLCPNTFCITGLLERVQGGKGKARQKLFLHARRLYRQGAAGECERGCAWAEPPQLLPASHFPHNPPQPCTTQGAIDPFFDLLDETALPEGAQPLPYPSFPPLPNRLHYRSSNSAGGRGPCSSGGGGPPAGGAGR